VGITPHIKDVARQVVDIILPPQSLMTGSLEAGGIEGAIWANTVEKLLVKSACF